MDLGKATSLQGVATLGFGVQQVGSLAWEKGVNAFKGTTMAASNSRPVTQKALPWSLRLQPVPF